MKDRIRQIMESQHMTQQTFAQFIGLSPASLSGIFNGRTKPTINIIEAIKNKIPRISVDWLMFGTGGMYQDGGTVNEQNSEQNDPLSSDLMLDFDSPTPAPSVTSTHNSMESGSTDKITKNAGQVVVKYIDKPQRMITEIRVFFDDQTWETFVPKK